ncbi:unnamed protein product [Lampetra planeri]
MRYERPRRADEKAAPAEQNDLSTGKMQGEVALSGVRIGSSSALAAFIVVVVVVFITTTTITASAAFQCFTRAQTPLEQELPRFKEAAAPLCQARCTLRRPRGLVEGLRCWPEEVSARTQVVPWGAAH